MSRRLRTAWLQRGRLTKEAEGRSVLAGLPRVLRASTGPPHDGGGRLLPPTGANQLMGMLQRGRLPKEAEGTRRRSPETPRRSSLQRGRLTMEAEGVGGALQKVQPGEASTGPPHDGGGRVTAAAGAGNVTFGLQRGRLPKEAEGERATPWPASWATTLQRGRLPKEAEGPDASIAGAAGPSVASTGPPPEGGGRSPRVEGEVYKAQRLQRGRLPKEAEGHLVKPAKWKGQTPLQRGRLPKEAEGQKAPEKFLNMLQGFNGAASRRRRKGRGPLSFPGG